MASSDPADSPEPMFQAPVDITPETLAEFQRQLAEMTTADESGSSPLDASAVAMHTLFECLVRAGFTEDQALKYLAWKC